MLQLRNLLGTSSKIHCGLVLFRGLCVLLLWPPWCFLHHRFAAQSTAEDTWWILTVPFAVAQLSFVHVSDRPRKLSITISVSYIHVVSYTVLSNNTLRGVIDKKGLQLYKISIWPCKIIIVISEFIHSFSILSDDRSKASSKTMPPYSAMQSPLL